MRLSRRLIPLIVFALFGAARPAAADAPAPPRATSCPCSPCNCGPGCRCGPGAFGDFRPGPPTSPSGRPATVDLPAAQHMRNTGGSDGAGLCVFTSCEIASRWQNVSAIAGFQKWMTHRPGGGWPEKVDEMVSAFCREKGVSAPPYVQHTGGDESFLEVALATGRMPCVTYDGRDDFYKDRLGRPAQIAHMVCLAHLDQTDAAIIDNNRPGQWVWMTRAEFLSRWRGNSGGWAVVFLAPPPPTYPASSQSRVKVEQCPGGVCPTCPTCPNGRCPGPGDFPALAAPAALDYEAGCAEAKLTGNPLVVFVGVPVAPVPPGFVAARCDSLPGFPVGCVVVSTWVGEWHGGVWFRPGAPIDLGAALKLIEKEGAERNRAAAAPAAKPKSVEVAPGPVPADDLNFGVDPKKVHSGKKWFINGAEVDRQTAHLMMAAGLTNDADRWHLTAVGDESFLAAFRTAVAGLPDGIRGKVHAQAYPADHWAVAQFHLQPGVTLRKPDPDGDRRSAEAGHLAPDRADAAGVRKLVDDALNPKPPEPPTPDPTPAPSPGPGPQPEPGPVTVPAWLLVLGAALAWWFFRKK